MAVGDRIKRVRQFRGLTQKELGKLVGFDEKTADIRIAQYESNTRKPKEELLIKIADALEINFRSLYEPYNYAAEDVMFTLFDLDEHYRITIHDVPDEEYPDETHKAVQFNYFLLDEFFEEWALRKKELTEGIISKSEYMECKLNWPSTAGEDPRVKWRHS